MQTDLGSTITSAAVSDRGLSEKRPQNEDSYLELTEKGIFAVADGVGGAQAGDVASQMAVEILAEAFVNRQPTADAEDTMRAAFERANSAIYQMASDLPQLASMATTVVALQISGDVATIGHVGDSRLYRIDPHGRLHRETSDHSVVEEEVRAGRLTPEQALNHPSRNVISRALGAEPDVQVDLKTVMVDPGSTFLLCSDGITRHIADSEIEQLFSDDGEPRSITERMKEICFSRGAEDNLTAVVVRTAAAAVTPIEESLASFEEIEEPTVSTSRSAYAVAESPGQYEDEAATGEFPASSEPPVSDTVITAASETEMETEQPGQESFTDLIGEESDEQYLSDELTNSQEEVRTDASYVSSSVVVPAAVAPAASSQRTYESHDASADAPNGFLSKLVPAVFLLLVGSVIGASAYYYFFQPAPAAPAPPAALIEKSPDVPLTAFEEGRRLVDGDPQVYLNANAASPQDADDYFLLGRAFMLTGKYWEAKRAFVESRNRLAQADPKNAKTLAAEIAMAITIIETPGAAEAFTRERAAANPAAGNTNTNSNTNSNTNTNAAANTPFGTGTAPVQR